MIYLDHAAATPMSEKAQRAMQPYLAEQFFNPSAAYLPALKTRHAYEEAKNHLAHCIGAKGVDLVITASATESISLAFSTLSSPNAQVLISAVEHPAVLENARRFKHYDIISVDQNGRLQLEDLKAKISTQTELVSVCLASSEIGSIQPLSRIAELVRAERLRRRLAGEKTPIHLHCDASQGLGLVELKVARLGVDMLTISAAKIYGPKGIAALWHAPSVRLQPQIQGGGQEMGLRSGTENVAALMAFALAAEEATKHINSERRRLQSLRDQLATKLQEIPKLRIIGQTKHQLANFLPVNIAGIDAERLIFALEAEQVYLSTGAACAASKGQKSATLQAIGLSDSEIKGSLRISLGKLNNPENISRAGDLIVAAIQKEQQRLQNARD